MSISVEVALLSGRTATIEAGLDEEVSTLKRRAQSALGVGRGRLLDSSGSILDGSARIKNARLQHGDSLTFHINKVQASGNSTAFAGHS